QPQPLPKIIGVRSIRALGVFQNFASQLDLPPRVVIYGGNGSGKTTLSRLIRTVSHPAPTDGDFAGKWDASLESTEGTIQLPSSAASSPVAVHVFNSDYIGEVVAEGRLDTILVGEAARELVERENWTRRRLECMR